MLQQYYSVNDKQCHTVTEHNILFTLMKLYYSVNCQTMSDSYRICINIFDTTILFCKMSDSVRQLQNIIYYSVNDKQCHTVTEHNILFTLMKLYYSVNCQTMSDSVRQCQTVAEYV